MTPRSARPIALQGIGWIVYLGAIAVSAAISTLAVGLAALVFRAFNL